MFASNTSQVSNGVSTYIEDVFSTYLYTGNGLTQTINNGIELGAGYTGEVTLVGNGVAATGTATADSYIDVRTPIKVFDALVADGNYIWHSGSSGPHWWQYDFGAGNAKVVTRYRMMMRQSNDTYRATTWDFQGSNDGSTWTTLDSRSSQTFPSPTDNVPTTSQNDKFNTYFITSPASYRYYRFNNIASSSGSYVLIGELELIGGTSSSLVPTSGKGGLVWIKRRSTAAYNCLFDTARGANNVLWSNTTTQQITYPSPFALTSFNSNGFTLNAEPDVNQSGSTYASWTFRKQPKFFDVVTWTGDGVAGRTIAHNLGSVPGCIITKSLNDTGGWWTYHRTFANTDAIALNSTGAVQTLGDVMWNNTTPTATSFTVGSGAYANASGTQYVAYLFAHNAGGFGLTGTDNVISCGSFTTDGSGNATVNLGYEPQWLMYKRSSATGNWTTVDIMRGWSHSNEAELYPNLSSAEGGITGDYFFPTATGFQMQGGFESASTTCIYIAIRRGPMKTPTSGTSVFDAKTWAGTGTSGGQVRLAASSTVQAPDFAYISSTGIYNKNAVFDRLRNLNSTTGGSGKSLVTSSTDAEGVNSDAYGFFSMDYMNGFAGEEDYWSYSGRNYVNYALRRAPGFFDVVCYTGTGSATTQAHNLGVVPELMIVKRRDTATNWPVYSQTTGNTKYLYLNSSAAAGTFAGTWNSTTPTATSFYVGADNETNGSGGTFVNYLFASCPGVSKVGSYTGNGSSQTINCGFTGGARFVMIKRTDSTGDWYVWDTARGIVSANDPRLSLNSTAAEVTTDDSIDPDNSGFIVNQVSATNINVSSATYIYLAIA